MSEVWVSAKVHLCHDYKDIFSLQYNANRVRHDLRVFWPRNLVEPTVVAERFKWTRSHLQDRDGNRIHEKINIKKQDKLEEADDAQRECIT